MGTSQMMQWGAIIMSVLASLGFLVAFAVSLYTKDQPSMQLLVGAAISNFSTAVSFWLGSSAGSQKKDEAMSRLAETKP